MDEDEEYVFSVDVEGEDALSNSLFISRDLKEFDAIEVADVHFNHNSAVLLPEHFPQLGTVPVENSLDIIRCCYLFAMENPSKLMLIAGHCDRSGDPPYNKWLSKKRAENVQYVLLGQRQEWIDSVTTSKGQLQNRNLGGGKSKHEDYLMILKWINKDRGWPCDPGSVKDEMAHIDRKAAKNAILAFQESWNANSELRSQVNASPITVDGAMGPETWGAFFDLYMLKLTQLLELDENTDRLDTYQKACKFLNDNQKTIGCGETHASDPIRDKSIADRRVYFLFFDPGERPKLVNYPDCHNGVGDMKLGNTKYPGLGRKLADKCELFGAKGDYEPETVSCPRPRSPFLILFPALGLPAIANDGVIDVIALVRKGSGALERAQDLASRSPISKSGGAETENDVEGGEFAKEVETPVKEIIVRSIGYVPWERKDKDKFKAAKKLQPDWITDLEWIPIKDENETPKFRKVEFPDKLHQLSLRISSLALKQYSKNDEDFFIDGVLRFHLKLPDPDSLYNLVNQFDESYYVRSLLRRLKSPFDRHTMESKYWRTLRDDLRINVYHPFLITKKDLLSIAHVTDVHVSTFWDLCERHVKKASIMSDGKYNNYNTRFEDVLKDIEGKHKGQVDIVVMTGDLIDYNRGHRVDYVDTENLHTGMCDSVRDYFFNRNWILFYELLIKNYTTKPVFTLLGNHEYLLNPYSEIIEVNVPWYVKFVMWLWNKGTTQAMFAGDLNLTEKELEKLAERVNAHEEIKLTKTEAMNLIKYREEHNIEELENLLKSVKNAPAKFSDPAKGTWFVCEESVLWYFLVINPFKDYSFSHKELAFLMVDWNIDQDKGTVLLLPSPTKCLSGERMQMVENFIRKAASAKYRIFCCHAPVIDPWPELGEFYMRKAQMKKNHDELDDYPLLNYDSEKFDFGAIEKKSRIKFIENHIIGKDKINLCLCGHSHTNKVFQIEEVNKKQLVFLRKEDETGGCWDSKSPVMMVTTSAGPIGRTNEISEWADLLPSGYRIVGFDNNGKISSLLVSMNKEMIREEVLLSIERNDPADPNSETPVLDKCRKYHQVDRYKIFHGRSKPLDYDHSAVIDEIAGSPKIKSFKAGRVIVIKRIPAGVILTIEGVLLTAAGPKINEGSIVVQRNEGSLVIKENWKGVIVDENLGSVTVDENADTIIVHQNGDPKRAKPGVARVIVNSSGRRQGSIPVLSRLFGSSQGIVRIYNNFEVVNINGNKADVQVGVNKGTIEINKNDGGIYVFNNTNGKLDVWGNSGTIQVASSMSGKIKGSKKDSVVPVSEEDFKLKKRATGEPEIDDFRKGPQPSTFEG